MDKVACYIYDDMVEYEVTFALHIISDTDSPKKKEIITVSETGKDVRSRSGLRISADAAVSGLEDCSGISGLVIPGGYSLNVPEDLKNVIRKLDSQGKLLAAICAGPYFLASAGVLAGRRFSTTLSPEFFKNSGIEDCFNWENLSSADIVRSRNIITAKYNAFMEFGLEIQEWFGFFEKPVDREWARVFRDINSE